MPIRQQILNISILNVSSSFVDGRLLLFGCRLRVVRTSRVHSARTLANRRVHAAARTSHPRRSDAHAPNNTAADQHTMAAFTVSMAPVLKAAAAVSGGRARQARRSVAVRAAAAFEMPSQYKKVRDGLETNPDPPRTRPAASRFPRVVAPTIEKASLVDKAEQSVIRPPLTVVSCPVPNRRSPPSAPRFSSRSPRLRPKPRAASSSPSPLSASPPPVRTPPNANRVPPP